MKIIKILVAAIILFICQTSAYAHTLWINAYESIAHPPGHIIASIGWGHSIPMDDLPGELNLGKFLFIQPDLNSTELSLPDSEKLKPLKTSSGIEIVSGDIGVKKFILSKSSMEGTYRLTLDTKGNYYSKYRSKKGGIRWAPLPMDEIKNKGEVIEGMKYKAFASAFFAVGKWVQPKPIGQELEIIPKTDLTNIHVGDRVDFEILFMGKPLTTRPETSFEYITAKSNSFGGPDGFSLSSVINDGKGGFRMPAAGQWLVNVYTRQNVTSENEAKAYFGKCTTIVISSTISFNVKP